MQSEVGYDGHNIMLSLPPHSTYVADTVGNPTESSASDHTNAPCGILPAVGDLRVIAIVPDSSSVFPRVSDTTNIRHSAPRQCGVPPKPQLRVATQGRPRWPQRRPSHPASARAPSIEPRSIEPSDRQPVTCRHETAPRSLFYLRKPPVAAAMVAGQDTGATSCFSVFDSSSVPLSVRSCVVVSPPSEFLCDFKPAVTAAMCPEVSPNGREVVVVAPSGPSELLCDCKPATTAAMRPEVGPDGCKVVVVAPSGPSELLCDERGDEKPANSRQLAALQFVSPSPPSPATMAAMRPEVGPDGREVVVVVPSGPSELLCD
ncbi:hypothetical protein EDB84DRAFT_1572030 [Lactarius hengduanensis]|nr:hypothetical protein EDB84DRAFT_1572030 [Lactarius hengduanensis]